MNTPTGRHATTRIPAALAAFAATSLAACLTGCITRGKAKEAHVSFGVPSVFSVEKHETGISLTEGGTLKAADSQTRVQILLFAWESRGKDVEIKFDRTAEKK